MQPLKLVTWSKRGLGGDRKLIFFDRIPIFFLALPIYELNCCDDNRFCLFQVSDASLAEYGTVRQGLWLPISAITVLIASPTLRPKVTTSSHMFT